MLKSTVLNYFISGTTICPENEETQKSEKTNKISSMEKYSSPAIALLKTMEEEKWQFNYCRGSYLGTLKCLVDTLPPSVAKKQQVNGKTLDVFIKSKVDENVLDVLEESEDILPEYFLGGFLKYAKRANSERIYETLLSLVCGYRYGGGFREEIFKKLFPKEMSFFVVGFSVGYHQMMEELCKKNRLSFDSIPPVEELIRNWNYFFTHSANVNYRLDGSYINPISNSQVPRDSYAYKNLQERPANWFDYLEIAIENDI